MHVTLRAAFLMLIDESKKKSLATGLHGKLFWGGHILPSTPKAFSRAEPTLSTSSLTDPELT
jgi:hypothetical protein